MTTITKTTLTTVAVDPDAVTRASEDAGGTEANNFSLNPSISEDGRYVAFESSASNLVAGDTNGNADVFLKDLETGAMTRLSTNALGVEGNYYSEAPSISPDGRFVAFASYADNLVAGDTNGAKDIFLRDLLTDTITRVSTDAGGSEGDGDSSAAAVSSNGQFVAFLSDAANLVAGDTNGKRDAFVKDLSTGTVTRVSTDSSGAEADNSSYYALSISATGRYVAFNSYASNLVAGDTNGEYDIFVKDLDTGTTTRVSTDGSGAEANSYSFSPSISADGRYVAFESYASNLVAGDTNGAADIFVKDLVAGTITRVSTDADGVEGNSSSSAPSISADGLSVSFESYASNLVAGDTNGTVDVFVKNLATGAVTRVSTDAGGTDGDDASFNSAISADGQHVAYRSVATNLVADDTNGTYDIFVADVPSLSLNPAAAANRAFRLAVETPDATLVTFDWGDGDYDHALPESGIARAVHGYAADGAFTLTITAQTIGGEGGDSSELESAHLVFGSTALNVAETPDLDVASTASDGTAASGNSSAPSVSADGRYVAFRSTAGNLVAGDTNGTYDIFVKDLDTGTTSRVSTDSGGTEANSLSFDTSISADGRYIAFSSYASNLVAGDTNGQSDVFVKDLDTGATTRVSTDSGGAEGNGQAAAPEISADGRYVAFRSTASNLVAGDTNAHFDIFVKDLDTGATTRVSTDSGGAEANDDSYASTISADGRYVVFESTASNLVAGATNGNRQVFVKDLDTGTTTLVSGDGGGTEGNGDSFAPSVSADGRHVAFYSNASNLVADDTNGQYDIFVKDLDTGTVTRASTALGGTEGNGGSYGPSISSDGRYVAFQSSASNLVAGDTNNTADVFLKDIQTGAIARISIAGGSTQSTGLSGAAAISGDGQTVAFVTNDGLLDGSGSDATDDVLIWHAPQGPATTAGRDFVQGSADADTVALGDGDDEIWAGAGDDTLDGGDGDDIIDGGEGADAMAGGSGDDVFYVDDAGDTVAESAGEGSDRIFASRSYTLPDHVEVLQMTGTDMADGTGNGQANTIFGSAGGGTLSGLGGNDKLFGKAGADTLDGGDGVDVLNGRGGGDTMAGGAGGDTYYVDDAGDTVTEIAGQGTDRVVATISFTLGDYVEQLSLQGAGLTGTGNDGGNRMTAAAQGSTLNGMGGNDRLYGKAGVDTLEGGAGIDILNGGAGADAMTGGTGADRFYVDDAGDTITENAGEGTDRVISDISYTLSDNVENLDLGGGTAGLVGTGNGAINRMTANNAGNTLSGLGSNDRLFGGAGDDILIGGAGTDRLTGFGGEDLFAFDSLDGSADHITDWTAGEDRIRIDKAGFGLDPADPVGLVVADSSAGLSGDTLFYNTNNGVIYFHDGDTDTLTAFARLLDVPASVAMSDFVFV
ncbi:hypothetical protein L2U69_06215 [Zavarzinia compransoris]|uniref:hypothetical protein n=1 Tax=Zavarzinia marina TaxID=2911065 RepID=UPI001F3F9161|nr:hypothetical protein [Zavarzinia marina]MCF4165232.1 hypothetical protein [Zavarzinia marina]